MKETIIECVSPTSPLRCHCHFTNLHLMLSPLLLPFRFRFSLPLLLVLSPPSDKAASLTCHTHRSNPHPRSQDAPCWSSTVLAPWCRWKEVYWIFSERSRRLERRLGIGLWWRRLIDGGRLGFVGAWLGLRLVVLQVVLEVLVVTNCGEALMAAPCKVGPGH